MKYGILIALSLAVFTACSRPSETTDRTSPQGVEVCIAPRLTSSDWGMVPMTRATGYRTWVNNRFKMVLLRRIDSRWIVHEVIDAPLDPEYPGTELRLMENLPDTKVRCTLQPGTYRAVGVINYGVARFNDSLRPGVVVADDENPSLGVRPLLTYNLSKHWANNGYRQLMREVFAGAVDFTVTRNGDLHSPAADSALPLRLTRRVAKLRLPLKENPGSEFSFTTTAYYLYFELVSDERSFPDGIDALGDMYYDQTPLRRLPWAMTTDPDWHLSGGNRYQLSLPNSTVYSPFIFVDEGEAMPLRLEELKINGQSGNFKYRATTGFELQLKQGRQDGVVVTSTEEVLVDQGPMSTIRLEVARDAAGNLEEAGRLFDDYYEWNEHETR